MKNSFTGFLNVIFNSYFNDFIVVFLFFSILDVVSLLNGFTIFSFKLKLILLFFAAIEWEFITPLYKKGSTTDILDILVYFLSAYTYLIIERFFTKRFDV